MRTTLELDPEIHEIVRRRAFEERRSMGEVVSELAKRGLEAERAIRPRRPLGVFAGHVTIAEDFDDTPAEWLEAIDQPLE